jgi:hypothetical protein
VARAAVGASASRPRGYDAEVLWLEVVFTGLLVLSSLAIGYVSLVVLYKLFAGQR